MLSITRAIGTGAYSCLVRLRIGRIVRSRRFVTLIVLYLRSVGVVQGSDLVHLRFSASLTTTKRILLSFPNLQAPTSLIAQVLSNSVCRILRYCYPKLGNTLRPGLRSEISSKLVQGSTAGSVVVLSSLSLVSYETSILVFYPPLQEDLLTSQLARRASRLIFLAGT